MSQAHTPKDFPRRRLKVDPNSHARKKSMDVDEEEKKKEEEKKERKEKWWPKPSRSLSPFRMYFHPSRAVEC